MSILIMDENHKLHLLANHLGDGAASFVSTEQQDQYVEHQHHLQHQEKLDSIMINGSLFDSGVHHLDLDPITSNNCFIQRMHHSSSSSPSTGIYPLALCTSLIHNQYRNTASMSPSNYLDYHQQLSPHSSDHLQQSQFYSPYRVYEDLDTFHQTNNVDDQHNRDTTISIVNNNNIHGEDNNNYLTLDQYQYHNDHYRPVVIREENHRQQLQQEHIDLQQSSTTQALPNNDDNNNHLNNHLSDNQCHANSLNNSLNSSSGTLINGVHNVSIIESSLISSSTSSFNTHHHHQHHTNNADCVNEEEYYPHTCCWSDCFLSFTDMSEFVKHIEETHVNSIPEEKHRYYCQWTHCRRINQPFNARYKLLIHMRVHSGEKPYPCEHESCKKSFSRLENLKIHIRSHTGEKPYSCRYDGCKKAFTNSSDRIKHHKTHLDAKPYACSYNDCDKRYTDPSSLRKHFKIHKKLESDSNKIDPRLNYIGVPKSNSSLDDKLSQSWSAGYNKTCQMNNDDNWVLVNDYSQCKFANSFTAGCSSSYMTPVEIHEPGGSVAEANLPDFACLATQSLNSL